MLCPDVIYDDVVFMRNTQRKKRVIISAPRFYGIDVDIRAAFEALGFEVVLISNFQHKLSERIGIKVGHAFPVLKTLINPLQKASLGKENESFISAVSVVKPDLLFIIRGEFLFPETLAQIKRIVSCPIIGYVWDEPFHTHDKNNIDDYRRDNFRKGVPLYDVIYVFDPFYIDDIKNNGARDVRYLPLATNPNRHREILVTDQDRRNYGYDVCFVGLPFENRIDVLERLDDYRLGIFGDRWSRKFALKGRKPPSYYMGKASGEIVNRIYLSSKIVLNIHHPQSKEGVNTRTFDIPACGAFEIVDYKKGVERHFEIDKEIVTFANIEELRSKIAFYLKNEDARRAIIARGKQRVLNEHTWIHRVKEVINSV